MAWYIENMDNDERGNYIVNMRDHSGDWTQCARHDTVSAFATSYNDMEEPEQHTSIINTVANLLSKGRWAAAYWIASTTKPMWLDMMMDL